MVGAKSIFDDLLNPLPPTTPRTNATATQRKGAKKTASPTLDAFFAPSPRSGLVARPKGKSNLRPTAAPPVVPEAPKEKARKPTPLRDSVTSTQPAAKPVLERLDSIGSIVPDSEEERIRQAGSPPASPSSAEDGSTPERAGVVVAVRRRLLSIEPNNASPMNMRTPRKKFNYDSSEDEDEDEPIPSRSAAPFFESPALDKRDVIIISDDEDNVARKVPKNAMVKRQSSLHSLVHSGTDGEREQKAMVNVVITPRKKPSSVHQPSPVIIDYDEIIPETQEDLANWSDDGAELRLTSPGGLKRTFSPPLPQSPFPGPSGTIFPTVPRTQSFKGLGIMMKDTGMPDEMSETSPRKVPIAVRSVEDDQEVIEISSDESGSDSEILPPTPKPRGRPPKQKLGPTARPATPISKGKGKVKGPVTPTSPSGKVSKAAKARLLEHYAAELFEDLNKRVFGGALDNCEIIWSKLLCSTAGKAYLKKERDSNGVLKRLPDGSQAVLLKIELSTKVVDCEERVRNTLSHEMCHLATWVVDGIGNPDHGSAWKKWVSRVMRNRPDIEISTRHSYEIAYKYSWQCTNTSCAHIYGRFSKSIDITKQGCGLCRAVLKPLFETTTKKSGWQGSSCFPCCCTVIMTLIRDLYVEFMKQNLKTIKSENPGISQSAAMQLLSEKWKQSKASNPDGGADAMEDIVAGLGRLLV